MQNTAWNFAELFNEIYDKCHVNFHSCSSVKERKQLSLNAAQLEKSKISFLSVLQEFKFGVVTIARLRLALTYNCN